MGYLKTDDELRSPYRKVKVDDELKDLHRHIMEKQAGRKLGTDEVVHHIDGNTHNNGPSNLCIMSRVEHARLHNILGSNAASHTDEAKRKVSASMRRYWKTHVNTASKQVAMCDKDGKVIRTFSSVYRVKDAGFDHRHVSACCLGKRKKHKGFYWKFVV